MQQGLAAVILAAGKGTRMKSALPKVLHPICGVPMLQYPLQAARQAGFEQLQVVIGHQSEAVRETFSSAQVSWVEQTEQLGTGHALLCAAEALSDFSGTLLLLCGDVPLLRAETLQQLLAFHAQQQAAVTVLTAEMPNPTGYGRIIRNGEQVLQIVEEKDASEQQRQVQEINTGTYLFDAAFVFAALKNLKTDNAQGEYYLTDVVAAAAAAGKKTRAICVSDPTEVMGINDRCQLAEAEALMRWRINTALMRSGVSMIDPTTVYVDASVTVGCDSVLHPNVQLRGATSIGSNCSIETGVVVVDSTIADGVQLKAGSAIEGAQIGPACKIGPMAHLRPGTVLLGNNNDVAARSIDLEALDASSFDLVTPAGTARVRLPLARPLQRVQRARGRLARARARRRARRRRRGAGALSGRIRTLRAVLGRRPRLPAAARQEPGRRERGVADPRGGRRPPRSRRRAQRPDRRRARCVLDLGRRLRASCSRAPNRSW